ncbi:MAG: FkbM family methyltransferase [Maritimibacter sp.]|nr:FkbM family methyltransferase [Maritimibacter sp.]
MLVRYADNLNFDIETNGERRVLECLAVVHPKCVFDVGANEGEWALLTRMLHPDCNVHCFEIVPSTSEILKRNISGDPHIVANAVGLSDEPGTLTISVSSTSSTTATANPIQGMKFHEGYYDQHHECEVTTGAAYVRENDIGRIDFLKIDVEGMDLRVLKGFGAHLERVRAVQFEYGIFNISSRDLLVDFFRLLTSHGFIVGKIYPRHVDFFDYTFNREDFGGHNYVAVKSTETALISALRGKARQG